MIRKRLSIGLLVAVLVLSVVGAGAVTTGALADDGAAAADGNDSRETATEMATNSTENGTIEANDTDWYAFEVDAGERIVVQLDLGSNDSTLDESKSVRIDIFGPAGEKVNEYPTDALGSGYVPSPGAPTQAMGGTIAEQSGTYYVRVDGRNITDYELTVETQRLDRYDPNEQPSSATPIESDETISGVMSGSDEDVYAIDLEKGETIDVTTNHDDSVLVNTQLLSPNARNASPQLLPNEYTVAWDYSDSFTYTANTSGTYFVQVTPHEEGIGSFDDQASYELSTTVSSEDDESDETENGSETDGNDGRETATEMATNSTENGTIDANDTDWYAFEADAGEQMNVGLELRGETNNSLGFDIFGPNGEETEESAPGAMRNPYSIDPLISTGAGGGDVAEQSGTYYVRVTGEGPTDYELSVSTKRLDRYEPNEQPSTATSINSDETISAVMSGLDRDTYAIELEKGETVDVMANITGNSAEYHNLVNVQLLSPNASDTTIRDFDSDYVVTDESPEADRFNHTANRSGTYFIRVYPVEHGMGSFHEKASYDLSAIVSSEESDDDESEETETDSGTDDTTDTPDDTEQSDSEESVDDPGDDTEEQEQPEEQQDC